MEDVAGSQRIDRGDGKGGLMADLAGGAEPGPATAIGHRHPSLMQAGKARNRLARIMRAEQVRDGLRREGGVARETDEGLVLRRAIHIEDARDPGSARFLEITS